MEIGKKGRGLFFYYYRYQIVPTTTHIQTTADQYQIIDLDDLLSKKNRIFGDIVQSERVLLQGRSADYVYRVLSVDANMFLLRIARKKDINIEQEDFSEVTIPTYPNVLVLVDNRKDIQKIAIQHNYRAFENTDVVANILENNFNRYLKRYQLTFYIKPIIEKNEFWELAHQYEGRITQVSFDILKPNLANISKRLSEDLKDLQRNTNSHRTRLELNAGRAEALENINSENEELAGLVEYSNEGGGEVSVKVKGIRKRIQTNQHIITEEIDEVSVKGKSVNQLMETLKVALTIGEG